MGVKDALGLRGEPTIWASRIQRRVNWHKKTFLRFDSMKYICS